MNNLLKVVLHSLIASPTLYSLRHRQLVIFRHYCDIYYNKKYVLWNMGQITRYFEELTMTEVEHQSRMMLNSGTVGHRNGKLRFNVDKCNYSAYSRNKKCNSSPLAGTALEESVEEKDLRIENNNSLNPFIHAHTPYAEPINLLNLYEDYHDVAVAT